MIRQPMLRRRSAGRWAIGLLGVATALLLSPVAAAQPDVDANNAITAAWQATGGDAGPLGPQSGDVYPVGAGFAQNFASGKVFFTPATGAHAMQGAILEKYESLGGPADSDLGFPTIDEGDGRAPGSRNSTFSAPDNPVIFWTPDTGAHVVRGPLNAAWDKLGGSSAVLGVPSEDETYDGSVVSQKFTGGQVSYDSRTKKFTTDPPELADQLGDLSIPEDPVVAINAARRAAGGPLGPLGASDGEPYKIGSDGMGQDFVNGKIFYSPDTGANVVTGQVLAKYESVGGPEGDLGFPITGEVDGGVAPASRMSSFAAADKPVIFWTPDYGAVIVRGAMNAAWEKLGGATGALGAPVSDQSQSGDDITQKFSGGALTYNTATKKFTTEPGNLASQLAGLEVPGQQAPQATQSSQAADSGKGSGFRWTWWWLLAIVPVLLVLGVVALAVARNRRRGRDDDDLFGPPPGDLDADDRAYGTGPTGDDGREDTLFGDRYAREGLGSLGSTVAATPSSPSEGYEPVRASFWGAQEPSADAGEVPSYAEQEDPDAVDTAPTRVPTPTEVASEDSAAPADADREPLMADEPEPEPEPAPEPESAPEPEPVPLPVFDAVTDTGRHARIGIDEPAPMGTALHLPLDDPDEVPDGYPVKADTRSGLYWIPGSADYEEAPAQIWFATEEIARTNGFVRGE
ncbi:LGFP repeat-containing protein [Mycolicibacterium chlorophenolicum]|uniref:LGFP repeat protein n=1 Tax=Mycolicibacterium chlorophenolicum TaxID=37916 RepID=A0A0J6W9H3_9MYCO|nr:LGFP repeat-containing protein [Mycolicibacterium chlorophenolicum]KMO78307.1 LGFP repeat protein [Mycolicibacterium chlorophenolicum]